MEEDDIMIDACCEAQCTEDVSTDVPQTTYSVESDQYFRRFEGERYPWERTFDSSAFVLSNESFLRKQFDAAGYRVLPGLELEFLVRDPSTGKLAWVNVTDLPPVPLTK